MTKISLHVVRAFSGVSGAGAPCPLPTTDGSESVGPVAARRHTGKFLDTRTLSATGEPPHQYQFSIAASADEAST